MTLYSPPWRLAFKRSGVHLYGLPSLDLIETRSSFQHSWPTCHPGPQSNHLVNDLTCFRLWQSLSFCNKAWQSTVKTTSNRPQHMRSTITVDLQVVDWVSGLAISKPSTIPSCSASTHHKWMVLDYKSTKFHSGSLFGTALASHPKSVHPDRQAHQWLGPRLASLALKGKAYSRFSKNSVIVIGMSFQPSTEHALIKVPVQSSKTETNSRSDNH